MSRKLMKLGELGSFSGKIDLNGEGLPYEPLCPWAFERSRGAIKLQTLLDLRGSIPTFILVTNGRVNDKTTLDHATLEVGAFYVMDRGYIHFKRLFRITTSGLFL
jgi:hypothetical protein